MNLADVAPIADAILYEGYVLYPYRPSSLKNRDGWTFGVVGPAERVQSQCLVEGGPACSLEVKVRLLHPIRRTCDDARRSGWEASPREVDLGPVSLGALEARPARHELAFEATTFACDAAGLRREQARLEAAVELSASRVTPDAYRLTVRVLNVTPAGRAAMPLLASFASTHALLGVTGGRFVSPRDPPPPLVPASDACENAGAWPVLVGPPGSRDRVLCAPIILDDHPAIAAESPGDLFDGTEIDEVLTLRILTLTDDERREAAAVDERARALLARTEALGPDALARLHGALRRAPRRLRVGDRELGAGDRVRLRPNRRADIFDLALAGKAATIVSVEEDLEGRTYFTVTVDDDPGHDLGLEGRPGHRFFFGPDEVEPS